MYSRLKEYRISSKEHRLRIARVREELEKRNLDALYITNPTSILYTTGFSHIATERPAAVVIHRQGVCYLGPVIEIDHIPMKTNLISEFKTYLDYPGERHPIDRFVRFLKELGLRGKRIGTENLSGASGGWGYAGPSLAKKMKGTAFIEARDIIAEMRIVKSEEELRLLKESGKWTVRAHQLLKKHIAPGKHDIEVAAKTTTEASREMIRELGSNYTPFRSDMPIQAGFRGQVGPMSAIPHAISTSRPMRRGNVLGSGAGADVGGYSAELERTWIIGSPTPKQKRLFENMLVAQQAALDAFRPGARCGDVDKAARRIIKKSGCENFMRHHTGHSIGLDPHEPPWIDIGDRRIMREGMVFSCEPGIYVRGYAGFRHSDTVIVTQDGSEIITPFPRDLESLII
ncbi:MAG: M24 family metallopeptidase [Candidatus Geothermarchaeales archaeon]